MLNSNDFKSIHGHPCILEFCIRWDSSGMTNTATDSPDILDVAELRRTPTTSIERAGQFLGISRSSAYEMVKCGRLPVIELGVRRTKVPSAALLRLLGYEAS